MKNESKKLTLDDFKRRDGVIKDDFEIAKIAGGILGACHVSVSTVFNGGGGDIVWVFVRSYEVN